MTDSDIPIPDSVPSPSAFGRSAAPPQLDERLSLVASYVRAGCRVADVGTDHAYLPVWLVRAGICPSAVATDVRSGPMAHAAQTVATAGLEGRIAVRLGNGLACVSAQEVDDIVIAGMGGETMIDILQAAPWVKNGRYHLILQPMTKAELLHEYLLCSGWALLNERVADDGRHLYPVILAEYHPALASYQAQRPAAFLRGAVRESDGAASVAYLQKQRQRLLSVAEALTRANRCREAAHYRELAKAIVSDNDDIHSP